MSLGRPGPASTCNLILRPSPSARSTPYTLAFLPLLSHTKLLLLYSLCPQAVLPLLAQKSLPAPSSPTPPRDYGSLCPSLFLHWNVLGQWSCHSVYMVLLAHCRHSTDMMPTNDWSNLPTPSPSPIPFTLFSPATQTSSQSFKQIPATGPLHVLLPGTSSLSFFLHDNFFSS